ncbi:MAG: DUF3047 domain-containing protein [Pseudomonadales bacterium]|nr:DUF3047 domain-containing protein [Pseudomonadales bacterium]
MSLVRWIVLPILLPIVGISSAWSYELGDAFGPWDKIIFNGEVIYTQVKDVEQGLVIRAESHSAASGLIVSEEVELSQTPFLHWSWKLEQPLQSDANEQSKAGDDFSVRVYVVAKGLFPWQAKAISYIWSRRYPVGTVWDNPFASHSKMVVVESGNDRLKQWLSYSRNVEADFRSLFGKPVRTVDGVAIMSDTDNTGSDAVALYGPYRFSR